MLAPMPAHPSAAAAVHRPGTPRQGDDRCPGALRLHQADDGYLARVRVPGGRLSARQTEAIGSAALELGDGAVHVTSRGNLQLRGLEARSGQALARRLHTAGLLPSAAHDRIRNVVASPLSGLDAAAVLDIEPLVAELDRVLCGSQALTALSGRFLFALDDGRGDVLALDPDLAAVAESRDRMRLWVGARPTTRTCAPRDAADLLAAAAHDFLRVARSCGAAAWRVADLGPDAGSIAPSAHGTLRPRAAPPAPGLVRAGAQVTGVHATFPLGKASGPAWAALTSAAQMACPAQGSAPVRITAWRGAVVVGATHPAATLRALAGVGMLTDAGAPLVGVTACTGLPGCGSSRSDVRAEAAALRLRTGIDHPLHVCGCERRCGSGTAARVEAVATGPGRYAVRGYGVDGPGSTRTTIELPIVRSGRERSDER